MEKKMFSAADFIKLLGFIIGLGGLYFADQHKTDQKFSELKEAIINSNADNRILISRVEKVESSSDVHEKRVTDLEKFRYQTEAILEDKLKIKQK